MAFLEQISSIKSLVEQGLNCWLQYALAQPIDIDLEMMTVLSLQFFGMHKLTTWLEKVKPFMNGFLKIRKEDELLFEHA